MTCTCLGWHRKAVDDVIGNTAIVLSAGLGVRMRPLTETRPKPLVEVKGKALIEYGIGKLLDAGVKKVVVNVHHFPDQIEAWAKRQSAPAIEISNERAELLDTGGGVAFALPRLGNEPFYVINSDSIWIDGKIPALNRLRHAWRDDRMDCLLLLCPLDKAIGYSGNGDFVLLDDGRLLRLQGTPQNAAVYIGAYLVHPRLFAGAPKGKFSMNSLWDKAIASGRLHGIVHDGLWFHVGTPGSVTVAEAELGNCH